MLLHASPPTAATRSLSQTGLCAPGTASLPIRSLWLPAGDPKATGQLQEVPWDHRPLDCTLDSMRNDRVLQPPIGGQDQRREPPSRSVQSSSALIEAKLNRLRQTHGKTPTELPCALSAPWHARCKGSQIRLRASSQPFPELCLDERESVATCSLPPRHETLMYPLCYV